MLRYIKYDDDDNFNTFSQLFMQCPMKMLNQESAKGTLAKVLSSGFIVFSRSGKAERHSRSLFLWLQRGRGDRGPIDPFGLSFGFLAELFFLSDIKLNVAGCLWGQNDYI